MCDFLPGHLAGERVYPGDKGKYYLPINRKNQKFNSRSLLVRRGEWKIVESARGEEERDPGGRSNIKPGIVTDSMRQQCMIFVQNLWRNKKACRWNLYIQLLLPFLCLNLNLSLELKSRIIG